MQQTENPSLKKFKKKTPQLNKETQPPRTTKRDSHVESKKQTEKMQTCKNLRNTSNGGDKTKFRNASTQDET